ncbi:MAG: hypothetical protein KatS3mg125_1239 [Lysobacterales bacterium]|jgi:hypothetical protein|nr:MAG: hypothetical protein KatS3mg125_1239 [Xanthomonadales bacterium]
MLLGERSHAAFRQDGNRKPLPRIGPVIAALRYPLLLASALVSGSLAAQAYFAHGDWAAACDASRSCTALALPPANAAEGMDLVLLRDGGAHDRVVWIDLMPRAGLPLDLHARLFADDHPLFPIGDAHILLDAIAEGRADQLRITASEEIEALLGALRKASRIRLVAEGRSLGDASAEGASAVLLWIDERQGRVGRENALIRRGPVAADRDFPPPPRPPEIPHRRAVLVGEQEVASAALAAAHARLPQGWCEPLSAEEREDRVWRLSGVDRLLVEIDCARARDGRITRWFLVERGSAEPLVFRRPAIDRRQGGTVALEALVEAVFDPMRGEIRSWERLRSRDDCGRVSVFRDDGAGFALAEDRYLDRCRGARPEVWPLLHSAAPP